MIGNNVHICGSGQDVYVADVNSSGELTVVDVTVEASLTSIETDIEATNTALGTVNTNLTTIMGYVDGVETLLTAIDGHVDGIETLIGSTNTWLSTIDSHVDGIETALGTVNSNLSQLGNNTDTLEALITSTNSALSTVNTHLTDIEAAVESIDDITRSTPVQACEQQTSSTASTGATLWDPTTDTVAVITDIIISVETATNIHIYYDTDTDGHQIVPTCYLADNMALVINFRKPYVCGSANDIVKFTNTPAAKLSIMLYGYEV